MYLLIPLISLSGLALVFANLFKTRFTFSLPIVTSILIGVLTLASALNILYIITGLIILIGVMAQCYILYAFFPRLKESIIRYKVEILVISLLMITYCVYVEKSHLAYWDDLDFWGVFIKELKLYNVIYPPPGTKTSVLLGHIHYPRGASLFYYFISYFTDCNEVAIIRSQFILHIIFLSPIMANRYWWQTIGLVSLMLVLPVQWNNVYTTCNDGLIALIFASTVIIFILEDDKYKALFLIAPILLFMPLFREVGLWLGLLACLIITADLIVNNDQKFKTNAIQVRLLMLFTLPIIMHYVWFAYVEAHVTIARPSHGLALLKKLIEEIVNVDGQKRAALFCAIDSLIRGFTDRVYLIVYFISFTTWLIIYIYVPSYKKSYNSFLIISVICLIIYVIWRVYLYLSILEAIAITWLTDNTFRYIMSFTTIFIAVPCAYAKKILFEGDYPIDFNNPANVMSILISVIAFSYVAQYLYYHIPILAKNPWAISIRKNAKLLNDLYSKAFDIEYDFSYMNANNGEELKRQTCYTISYFLSPYFSSTNRGACVKFKQLNNDNIDPTKFNTMNSNIDINTILENPELYRKNCKIKYFLTYNYVDIQCNN